MKQALLTRITDGAVILTTVWLISSATAMAADSTSYRFGIYPHMPPGELQQSYQPLASSLSKNLSREVEVRTPDDKDFQAALSAEQFDVAFVQPFDYVWAHDKHNYVPLASRGGTFTAVFVVNKNSPINSLEDLREGRLITPPPSFAVSKMAELTLQKKKLTMRTEHAHSDFSCLQQVLIKNADVCVTTEQALQHFESNKMADRFRVIYKTPPLPQCVYIVHKRVPQADREILKKAILGFSKPKGFAVRPAEEVVETTDSKYNIVRNLNESLSRK